MSIKMQKVIRIEILWEILQRPGQCVVPVLRMQPGYRHVPLKNVSGKDIEKSFLFVHIAIDNSKKKFVRIPFLNCSKENYDIEKN